MSDFAELFRASAVSPEEGGTLVGVFDEEPVSLTVFVQDRAYLGNPPLSPVQYEAVRHIERIYYPNLYPRMAREFEAHKVEGRLNVGSIAVWRDEPYWSHPIRMTNFATLQWGKGCLCKYIDVYNAQTGRWAPVGDMAEATVQGVDAVNPGGGTDHLPEAPALVRGAGRVTARTDGPAFRRGFGRCVRVTTALGAFIDVYVGHLFVTWAQHNLPYKNRYLLAKPVWRQAGNIQPGDRIAILSKLDCLEPQPQDPHEVELVGYWIGDGCMPVPGSTQWAFYIDPKAVELLDRYTRLVESYPGISAKLEPMPSGALRVRATGVRGGPSPLVEIIRRWGLYGSRAWDKRVPAEFFSLPDDQLATFISALWDTDGCVYWKVSGSSRTPSAEYCTVSEGLARDLQRLLFRFGVVSKLASSAKTYRYKGELRQGRVAWRVTVDRDQYMKRLLAVLRLHGRKEALRLEMLDHVAIRQQQVSDGDVYWDTVKSIEDIGEHEYWDMRVPESGSYVAGTASFISSNSGKDHVARVASMRIAYLLMCLVSPQDYYGIPDQDTIHLLNVASSSGQAQQAFFMPIVRAVKRGWFDGRCEPRQNVVSYHKNIESISGHSDAETQEGLNLMLSIADEIDAFKTRKESTVRRGGSGREPTKSAEGIIGMMRTSGRTRFPKVFKNVYISYPRYLGSKIQQLTAEARKDITEMGIDSEHYVSGPLATWEVNPRVTGKEAFAGDYREDPVTARAKYECRPARAVNPYFRNHMAVDACFVPMQQMPIAVDYRLESGTNRPVWVPHHEFSPDLFPVRGAVYAMHADLAITGDRAGIAMAHVVKYSEHEVIAEDEDGAPHPLREIRPHVKVDFVLSYSADASADPAREIQIRWARQLCFELVRRGFNVRTFTFDSFQSFDSMQILEHKGIECSRVSPDVSEDPWRTLRDLMYEGRVTIARPVGPDGEPVPSFLLREELLSLTRLPNGRIDHPSEGSKDEADALACAVLGAVQGGGQEEDGSRAYFGGGQEISVGTIFDMPVSASGLQRVWMSEVPGLPY